MAIFIWTARCLARGCMWSADKPARGWLLREIAEHEHREVAIHLRRLRLAKVRN